MVAGALYYHMRQNTFFDDIEVFDLSVYIIAAAVVHTELCDDHIMILGIPF